MKYWIAFANNSLVKYNLDIRAVAAIVSVDVKANEAGIIKLAEKINCPFITFEREEIKSVQDKYEKSEFVLKTLGITGVCEPCVDLAGAEVIISKVSMKVWLWLLECWKTPMTIIVQYKKLIVIYT